MEPLEGGVGSTGCGWSGGVGEEGVEVGAEGFTYRHLFTYLFTYLVHEISIIK